MIKKIGITMRINDDHDALAHDWHEFMEFVLPGMQWVLIPNIKKDIIKFINKEKINGFILTGGNNIGDEPKRDITESFILEYASMNDRPVFGVCRGLQMIQTYFNGELWACDESIHVGKKHEVILIDGNKMTVNSYHNFGIHDLRLSLGLRSFAKTINGGIEGAEMLGKNIMGVMWHPERGRPFREYDRKLIRKCFGVKT